MNVARFLVVREAAGGILIGQRRVKKNVGTQRNAESYAGAPYT